MNSPISPRGLAVFAGLVFASPAFALVNIDYVSVGNAGNAADPVTGNLYGAVAYPYRIGKFEVTNAQYTEFLNAVDPSGTNANGIYNTSMGSDARGGISFSASAPSGSKYTIRTSMGDKPVNWVSWRSAARFTNWLHNGQGSGSTETGAYTMSGNPVTRNEGATVFLPTENEWYKAAYYDPTPGAGGGDNYWTYATQSNTAPTAATANATGAVANPGANVQNYGTGADWNGQNGNVTTAGTALANNYFGTQDMGGNVREWQEDGANNRDVRGGSWSGSAFQSSSGDVSNAPNTSVFNTHGFRVASIPAQAVAQALSFAIDANKNPVLQWPAEAGRRYSVLYSTDLKKFTPIAKGFPFGGAQSPGLQFKDLEIFTGTTPRAFYKLEELPASAPDSVAELDAFFTSNGGRAGFQNNQVMALETLLFALDEIEAGQLVEARARVDAMLAAYPLSTPGWNAGYGYRGLNMGDPVGYYGIRMLDQILTLGNPSRKGKLRMTAVVAPSAVVTRPTLPNLVPETVNLNIAPEILAEDAHRLHLVTRLFRRWLQAITGGLEVELVVHVMNQGTTVNFVEQPDSFSSLPDARAMLNAVPASIANTTDIWWVIAPSGVPGDGSGFSKTFVSGGITTSDGTTNGSPLIMSDDAWFIRKPVHLGSGPYSETELGMYLPMWFQHEIMHAFFWIWPQFGLEAQSHQWFDRSTWPADFVGVNEADYYAEALTKRILPLGSPDSVADRLQKPDYADMAVFPVAKLVGNYRRNPVQNGFHEVTITLESGNLRWSNAAGSSWGLEIIGSDLWSLPNSVPYGAQKYRVQIDGDGNVIGIDPGNNQPAEFYRRNDYPHTPAAAAAPMTDFIMPMPTVANPIACPGCSFHPTPE
jgi:formylglycine-generating enzyme required for sulfatase activity